MENYSPNKKGNIKETQEKGPDLERKMLQRDLAGQLIKTLERTDRELTRETAWKNKGRQAILLQQAISKEALANKQEYRATINHELSTRNNTATWIPASKQEQAIIEAEWKQKETEREMFLEKQGETGRHLVEFLRERREEWVQESEESGKERIALYIIGKSIDEQIQTTKELRMQEIKNAFKEWQIDF